LPTKHEHVSTARRHMCAVRVCTRAAHRRRLCVARCESVQFIVHAKCKPHTHLHTSMYRYAPIGIYNRGHRRVSTTNDNSTSTTVALYSRSMACCRSRRTVVVSADVHSLFTHTGNGHKCAQIAIQLSPRPQTLLAMICLSNLWKYRTIPVDRGHMLGGDSNVFP
jgi:hypothetical protein